jgi:hypothetical protein
MNNNRSIVGKILAAGIVSCVLIQTASAGFVWDLRATAKNGNPLSGGDSSKVVSALPGDVITLTLFAQVTGTGAGVEAFQSGLGKTITTHSGGSTGNQGAPAFAGTFTGGSLGTVQDLNGDGFTDIGSTATTTSTTAGNWFPRYVTNGAFETNGIAITDGQEFALFTFTYTAITTTGTASVQWTQQLTTVINSATFQVDGATVTSKNIGLPAGANATTVGSPVVIGVPEPTAFGMVALGALSLVGFRRFGVRRSA